MIPAIYRILRSNKFFYITLGLFTLGVLWIALASIYPMAFDEEFHYGLIKIYATSWLPYGIQHTTDMAQYGSATADASYLFHYLMSFPYRILNAFGLSDMFIIICLRLINVGLVAAAIVVFRKALLEAKLGRLTTNVSLLFFMFIPVLSMLAAQINYDNLLLLIVALSTLLSVRITQSVLAKKGFPASPTWYLLILLVMGACVKYAFLPIAGGVGIWLIVLILIAKRNYRHTFKKQFLALLKSTKKLATKTKSILIALGLASAFFALHYVTNYAQYGSPIPPCEKVFDEQACNAYGPWERNHRFARTRPSSFQPMSVPQYVADQWVPGMARRLTFALAGKTNGFQTKDQLPIVYYGFWSVTIVGLICLAARMVKERLKVGAFTWFTLLLCTTYAGVLVYQLYGDYVETGVAVAINGRYLLLLLPLFGAVLLQSIGHFTRSIPKAIPATLLVITLVLFLVGGAGAGTYIVQSESHWLWPGFGQWSQPILQSIWNVFTLPLR